MHFNRKKKTMKLSRALSDLVYTKSVGMPDFQTQGEKRTGIIRELCIGAARVFLMMSVCVLARSQAAAVFRCRLWARPKPISWCSRNLRRSYDSTSVSSLASTRHLTAWTPATSTHSPSGTLAAIWVLTNIYCSEQSVCVKHAANLLLSYQHLTEIQIIIRTLL